MKKIKAVGFILIILLGIALFIYGGYDDSPGAQGLGVIVIISGLFLIIKNK